MDTIDPVRFLASFFFVIGLIGVAAFGLKRWVMAGKPLSASWFAPQAQKGGRLEVVEVRYIDAKRKLALVRRDDKEHLLLLAEGREVIIESGIVTHEK